MFFIETLNGTCIGRVLRLRDSKVFPKTEEEFYTNLRNSVGNLGSAFLFIVTTEEQKEFRDLLEEGGLRTHATENGSYHHSGFLKGYY